VRNSDNNNNNNNTTTIILINSSGSLHTQTTGTMCQIPAAVKYINNIYLKISKMLLPSALLNEINTHIIAQPSTEKEKIYTS
jgi:hypothetical protein